MVMNHPRLRSENFMTHYPEHVNGGFFFVCTIFDGVSTHFPFFPQEIRKTQKPGDGPETSPVLKSGQIDLRISGYGNFWVGITNPRSVLFNSILAFFEIQVHIEQHRLAKKIKNISR
ncbi:unnamed protein product, partial [Pylaiella littoralis]